MSNPRRKLKTKYKVIFALLIILILSLIAGAIYILLLPEEVEEEVPVTWGDIGEVDITEDATPAGDLTFIVIDVGQAQSLFIDKDEFEVLIDAGSYNDGSKRVYKTIKDYVDGPLELVIGTHSHEDHIGGMAQVYDNFKVKQTIYGDVTDDAWCDIFLENAKAHGNVSEDFNTTIELGPKTTLTIYDIEDGNENSNNNSVICLLKHGKNTFFMTGDLEEEVEVKLRKTVERVDVYVLSHHGSDTSNTLLDVMKPRLSLASCAKDNDYGHINKSVIEDAVRYSGKVFATYRSGTMILTSDGKEIAYSMDNKERLTKEDYGKNPNN